MPTDCKRYHSASGAPDESDDVSPFAPVIGKRKKSKNGTSQSQPTTSSRADVQGPCVGAPASPTRTAGLVFAWKNAAVTILSAVPPFSPPGLLWLKPRNLLRSAPDW